MAISASASWRLPTVPAARTRSPIPGSVYGGYAAILAASNTGTTIVNTGKISAGSNFAIGVYGGPTTIYNAGHITGFVLLDADDTFINEKGGVFETKGTAISMLSESGATICS